MKESMTISINSYASSTHIVFDKALTRIVKEEGFTHATFCYGSKCITILLNKEGLGKPIHKIDSNNATLYCTRIAKTIMGCIINDPKANYTNSSVTYDNVVIHIQFPVTYENGVIYIQYEGEQQGEQAYLPMQSLSDYTNEEIFAEARKRGYKDVCLCTAKELYNELLKRGYEGEMSRKEILK